MTVNPEGANFFNFDAEESQHNPLLEYLQHQSPEVLSRVAKSVTSDVKQIIFHNVQGLVGLLPAENFEVQITTDREHLASLLASAMVTGYFLRQMEQRMELDDIVDGTLSLGKRNPSSSYPFSGNPRQEFNSDPKN